MGLIDLDFSSLAFMWWRSDFNNFVRAARLDKIMCTPFWRLLFSSADVYNLPRAYSDHCLLLLSLENNVRNGCTTVFSFQAAWQKHQGYADFVSTN